MDSGFLTWSTGHMGSLHSLIVACSISPVSLLVARGTVSSGGWQWGGHTFETPVCPWVADFFPLAEDDEDAGEP